MLFDVYGFKKPEKQADILPELSLQITVIEFGIDSEQGADANCPTLNEKAPW